MFEKLVINFRQLIQQTSIESTMAGNQHCNNWTFYWHPMYTWILTTIYLLVCVCHDKLAAAQGFSFDAEIGNVTVYAGQSATLICDLRDIFGYTIFWYHRERQIYLSYDDVIQGLLPGDLEDRLSIACDFAQELCSLTISHVSLEDKGTYECGHLTGAGFSPRFIIEGYLNVIVEPPSENSPFCLILGTGNDNVRKTHELSHSETSSFGQLILLSCFVNGTTTPPSLTWNRADSNLTSETMTNSLEVQYVLSKYDYGVQFTCLMTHPAIQEQRNCSFIPLGPKTTTGKHGKLTTTLATEIISIRTNQIVMKTEEVIQKSTTESFTDNVLYVLLSFAIVTIGLLGFLLWRKKKMPTPNQSSLNPTATAAQGASDYTELAARDKEPKYEDLKATSAENTATDDGYTYPTEHTISGDNEVAAVSDQYESVHDIDNAKMSSDNAEKETENVHFASYANLQRPVKAENFNA